MELVEQSPTTTTFKLWLAEYKMECFVECGTTIWKMLWNLCYVYCYCCRFHFTIISSITKRFVQFINGIKCSEHEQISRSNFIVWICNCSCRCEKFNSIVFYFYLEFSESLIEFSKKKMSEWNFFADSKFV